MNVTVQDLGPCKKLLRIEVDTTAVDRAFEETTNKVQREARLPGFRPGKIPRTIVTRTFAREIENETKRKLVGDSYRAALEEEKLRVIGSPDIEEIQFARGQPLQFAATIETAPQFELPDYRGIPVRLEKRDVPETDVDAAIEVLRKQQETFTDVDRPLQAGDVAVVNYEGTAEEKPLTDFAPAARGLTTNKNFWLSTDSAAFIPGFAEQLMGARAGERRAVNVEFAADFVTPQLAGRKATYDVELVQVKEPGLPAVDEAFAKSFGAADLAQLREGVRRDLTRELAYQQSREKRRQIIRDLLERVTFDVPESVVRDETRNLIYDVVRENQQRGIGRDQIEEQRNEIYRYANANARERIKIGFILGQIAQQEKITVTEEEFSRRIVALAAQQKVPVPRLVKQLRENDQLPALGDEMLTTKVLDFLEREARVEDAPANLPT